MRTLFYLLIFITPTALVLIYRDQIQTYLEDQGLLGRKPDPTEAPASPGSSNPPTPSPKITSTNPSIPLPSPSTPAITPQDIDQEVDSKYPLPNFKPLEALVGNWRSVPQRAFPKVVTLKKPVDLQLVVNGKVSGKSTLRTGQQAYPISLKGSALTVSGNPGNTTMIGTLSIDETDFKEQIQKTYDTWKQRQESRVVKLRKAEKQRLLSNASSSTTPIAAPASTASSLGQEPTVNPDGTVPVMIDSIKAGDVTEITLEKIQYWRWNGYEQIGGTDYYTGVVGYQTETIFGEINTEGKALIRGGKVAKWIYSGSEEEIK